MSICDLGKANNHTSMEAEANQWGKQKQSINPLTKKTIWVQHTIQQLSPVEIPGFVYV